jgi:uncharacterized protein (TIGR02284 family)
MSTSTVTTLNRLIRIARDGEQGFCVAAENVPNRGLKLMLKSFAQQRADFAEELAAEVRRTGGPPRDRGSFLAGVHRGWINIKAAMTIDPRKTEQVVLSEALRGERVAQRTYAQAQGRIDSGDSKELIERQAASVASVASQIERLAGRSGIRLMVKLFNEPAGAEEAVRLLRQQGFPDEAIRKVELREALSVDSTKRQQQQTVAESAKAGALLGLAVGVVVGLAAGIGAEIVPGMDLGMEMGLMGRLAVSAAVGGGIGALLVGLIGAVIGRGVVEEDHYLHDDGLLYGRTLLFVETDTAQADTASQVLVEATQPNTT